MLQPADIGAIKLPCVRQVRPGIARPQSEAAAHFAQPFWLLLPLLSPREPDNLKTVRALLDAGVLDVTLL